MICRCGPVQVLHPVSVDDHYATIQTDAKEFMIEVIVLKKGETYSIPGIPVPRILICYSGCGKTADMNFKCEWMWKMRTRRGSILFQVANNRSNFTADEDVVIYATHERI